MEGLIGLVLFVAICFGVWKLVKKSEVKSTSGSGGATPKPPKPPGQSSK